jgi:hypothetical protein
MLVLVGSAKSQEERRSCLHTICWCSVQPRNRHDLAARTADDNRRGRERRDGSPGGSSPPTVVTLNVIMTIRHLRHGLEIRA